MSIAKTFRTEEKEELVKVSTALVGNCIIYVLMYSQGYFAITLLL